MSERKVLNKYYPPDFDPSKIPKSKEPRNKTFCIRLMAPCNMRCTTCGEYIYKGRKFNARKEDVDDMNYLGLRIYRFYIKCTACVSEICFRTDPENTDYVLESGATRNFEALKRAEEQAEREDAAHREELENNPMKLLEERTQASKNEMELAESLDELRELNRRTVSVDYETMLKRYDDIRAAQIQAEEKADEDFVKAIFSENGGMKVKRLLDEDSSNSSESDKDDKDGSEPSGKKKSKPDKPAMIKPTDHLTASLPTKKEKKAVWEKSIGSLGSKKGGLGLLVKKKSPSSQSNGSLKTSTTSTSSTTTSSTTTTDTTFKKPLTATAPSSKIRPTSKIGEMSKIENKTAMSSAAILTSAAPSAKPVLTAGPGGLGLLGAYSDSDSSGSD